jgi:serine/threonine-protein kinase
MPTGLHSPEEAEAARRRVPSSSPVGRLASSDSIATGGFAPGTMLVERWRIVGLIGRGGMGEVYRADDLKLGTPVALKFLPASLAGDAVRRERFLSEVRLSRQISHPNVCRVYDIGEADGVLFLSMEYVDGEDLSSLLKRIGRLPPDKVLEIARQLCAGLAAAHDRGVLHRDLKPANVMLDGRGRVRITDFGLAVVGVEGEGREVSGTPAYMAPEQLEGKGASIRSDLYALGLVLYELSTGRKAYDAPTLAELRGRKRELPAPPSETAREMDPAVERVLLRCLDPDPARRPASAVQVAAALPGGDPLAAAIAAGETPSPEMVAAAGDEEGLSPRAAWSIAAASLLLTALSVWLTPQARMLDRAGYRKPPEVLRERSREILARLGYPNEPADTAWGFTRNSHVVRWIRDNDPSPERWDRPPDDVFTFWYREAPRPMSPELFSVLGNPAIRVERRDPPHEQSGMALVLLDRDARLEQLEIVPPQKEESHASDPAPDWAALFREAGIDMGLYRSVDPQWSPRTFADARAAWVGPHPNRPDVEGRIEAAAYRGRPVFFLITGPWDYPSLQAPYKPSVAEIVAAWFWFLLFLAILGTALLMARRNLRQGRGDLTGARKVGSVIAAASLLSWIIGSSHTATQDEIFMMLNAVAASVFNGGMAGVLYLALEPYARRRWPQALVSWSRLIAGRWRDPAVGRDVLIGAATAALNAAVTAAAMLLPRWLGRAWGPPMDVMRNSLTGLLPAVSTLFERAIWAVIIGFGLLFIFTALRAGLKRNWAAILAFALVNCLLEIGALQGPAWVAASVFAAVVAGYLIVRFGVVALVAHILASMMLGEFPVTADSRLWYFGAGALALAVVAAMTLWGARAAARGGKALPAVSGVSGPVRA